MADALAIKFSTEGLEAGLDAIAAGSDQQVRPAAQAGAQILYEEAVARAPVSKRARVRKGKILQPGALKASIYQVFSKDNSGDGKATYHVSWNAKKAPHGHLVEYGTSRAAAHPFIRPAFDARAQDALIASRASYTEGMRALIAGLK